MDSKNFAAITDSVPRIVVTEPSPVSVQTQSTASVIRQIEAIPEDVSNGKPVSSESVKMALEKAAATSEPGTSSSSGEFIPAKECNECVVSVPEQSTSESVDDAETTATLETDQDDFRMAEGGCCQNCGLNFIDCYDKVWKAINSGYALPIWLLLLSLPISAGIMGALYMYSCPASHSLTHLIFTVGISLMVLIALRISLIFGRMPPASENQDCWKMLHTLLLISTFLTVVFFITESVSFWKMTPSSRPGATDYCDPKFQTFSFWWNCVMSVVIVPIFLFPA